MLSPSLAVLSDRELSWHIVNKLNLCNLRYKIETVNNFLVGLHLTDELLLELIIKSKRPLKAKLDQRTFVEYVPSINQSIPYLFLLL